MSQTDTDSKIVVTKEPANPYTGTKTTTIEISSKEGSKSSSIPTLQLRPTSSKSKKESWWRRLSVSGWVSTQIFIITALTFTVALAWDNAFNKTFQSHNVGLWLYPIILTLAVVILSFVTDIGIKKIKEKHPTVKYYY